MYLLLTEFEVRTEVTDPRFFPYDLWPAQKTRLVRFLYISIVCLSGSGTILFMNQVESKTSQFEIVF